MLFKEVMAGPKQNTLDKDIEHYVLERTHFLEEQGLFKLGYVVYGLGALNHLESMYHILLACHHYALPDSDCDIKPGDHLKKIDELKNDIYILARRDLEVESDPTYGKNYYKRPEFKELSKRFDNVMKEHYLIKNACGLT